MNITVPPNVNVPGPTVSYGTVTINAGGSLIFYVQTTVDIQAVIKT